MAGVHNPSLSLNTPEHLCYIPVVNDVDKSKPHPNKIAKDAMKAADTDALKSLEK